MVPKTILMAYRGSEEDRRVLSWLCQFVKHARAQLTIAYILPVPFTHEVDDEAPPGSAEAEEMLLEAERLTQREGVTISADLVQARDAGSGLVSEADAIGADLLVLTDRRHTHLMENPLGHGTVAYLMRHAACPVWICYPPEK